MESLKYTTKINSSTTDYSTIDANNYNDICNSIGCYESIPDDKPIKIYTDIDIKGDASDYDNHLSMFPFILDRSKDILINFFKNKLQLVIEPELCICESNSIHFIDWKTKKNYWKISLHIIINNIIALKSVQKELIKEINKYTYELYPDMEDYLMETDKLFDESIYDKNRKLRSLYCSKPDENRPLNLYQGTFNQSIISCFIPKDAQSIEMNKPQPLPSVIPVKDTNVDADKYNKYFDLFMKKSALDKYAENYSEWRNIGFILRYEFGNDIGFELFDAFSKLCPAKYDYIENRKWWNKLEDIPKKPLTFATLIYMVKNDNNKIYEDVLREMNKCDNLIFVNDDNEAAEVIFERLKDKLVPCKGQLFFKVNYIWISDSEIIKTHILDYILKSKIYKLNDKQTDKISYSQNVKNAKNIREALFAKIETQTDIINLYDKFFSTTKGRLCFKDGVLDIVNKQFYLWKDVTFEYYTTQMINRNFAEYFSNPDKKVIEQIKKDIFENLFGEDTIRSLNFLSRGIAGHFEDKNWATYLGNRDCGKGVLYDILKYGFGDYVQTFELDNIMYQRNTNTQEASRMLYWLIDLQFVRLAISQETPPPESGLKANGKIIKKMAGGGDTHIARRNYDRKDTHFKIDTTFMIMGNNKLNVDLKDTMEHCIEFNSVNQFKKKEEIDKMKHNGEDELLWSSYKIKDETIKDKCKSEDWNNAIVYLLYENYINTAISVFSNDDDEEDNFSLRRKILNAFTITKNKNDFLLVNDVCEILKDCKKKINNELLNMGVSKKRWKSGEHCDKMVYYGITQKEIHEV